MRNWNHGDWNHGGAWDHGWGWRGRGFYPWFGFFPGYGLFGWGGLGYGGWGGDGDGGYSYPYYSNGIFDGSYTASYAPAQPTLPVQPTTARVSESADFATAGEQAFGAGDYQLAAKDWQHALVENPNNGGLALLAAQAMFGLGQYDAAANTVQMGMQLLPADQWGNVVKNYKELYPNHQSYADQLRALESDSAAHPDDPALRFLLGYHYGYLGYPHQAVEQLDKGLDAQVKDLGARKLRDVFAAQANIQARQYPAESQSGPSQQLDQPRSRSNSSQPIPPNGPQSNPASANAAR